MFPISGIDDVLLAEAVAWSAISCTFQWRGCEITALWGIATVDHSYSPEGLTGG